MSCTPPARRRLGVAAALEHDGDRDTTTFRFRTNLAAIDVVQIVNRRGRRVRDVRLGKLAGHRSHAWTWDGGDGRGHHVRVGTYRIRVVAKHYDRRATSAWLRLTVKRKHAGRGRGAASRLPAWGERRLTHVQMHAP